MMPLVEIWLGLLPIGIIFIGFLIWCLINKCKVQQKKIDKSENFMQMVQERECKPPGLPPLDMDELQKWLSKKGW